MLRLVGVILVILVVVWIVRLLLPHRTRLRCESCRHCRKLFEDGSLCGYGTRETFKTIVHIENCPDYQKR